MSHLGRSGLTMLSWLQPNSISYAALTAGHAVEAAPEREYGAHKNPSKRCIRFVLLAIEVFGGLSQTFKKALKKLADIADNRTFSEVLSVTPDKFLYSLSEELPRAY